MMLSASGFSEFAPERPCEKPPGRYIAPTVSSIGKDHRVELERYSGPLELLLWLIHEEEVDIHDIPIARILDRYLEVLQTLEALDLDQAGEFLVMASRLMQIKSRSLLPREDPLEDEDLDPRFELVQMLLEYRKYKEVSENLRSRAEHWALRFPPGRQPEKPGVPLDEVPLEDVSVIDLALAFNEVMRDIGDGRPTEIIYDDTPIETHMEEIVTRLSTIKRLPFADLFTNTCDRPRIAGIFLALLELIRQRRVRARQDRPFGRIDVEFRPRPDGPTEAT
jgi:segregation and condensation protein A